MAYYCKQMRPPQNSKWKIIITFDLTAVIKHISQNNESFFDSVSLDEDLLLSPSSF